MGWIGVDFDGTLCEDETELPVQPMVDRIKAWLARGIQVRIVTARASPHGQSGEQLKWHKDFVKAWCKHHVGQELPVTAQKDYYMIELWDDRAVTVEKNTGRPLAEPTRGFA